MSPTQMTKVGNCSNQFFKALEAETVVSGFAAASLVARGHNYSSFAGVPQVHAGY